MDFSENAHIDILNIKCLEVNHLVASVAAAKVVITVLLAKVLAASFLAFIFRLALGGAISILTDWCRRCWWYEVRVSFASIIRTSH